jgi:hypothetical protein
VRVWHGSLDTTVPVEVAAGMAALLPHVSATIWDGHGHGHSGWATSDAVVEVAAALTE